MSDISQQCRFLAGSYGGSGQYNPELAKVFQLAADEIERLRSDIALLGPVTTPLNGKQCASCYQDCCDHWTYCPSCGAQERIEDRNVRICHPRA